MDHSKLTLTQRLLRPVISFAVERFFSNGLFFYGPGPLAAFDEIDKKDGKPLGWMAALSLANLAIKANADEFSSTLSNVTLNGKPMGDWKVTIERVPSPAVLER